MRKISLLIIVVLFLLITCKTEPKSSLMEEKPTVIEKSTIPASPKVEQEKINLPQYNVLNEDLYDVPIKTQITLNILVLGEITEPGLRALLGQLYSSIKNRKGFKYHDSPTNIYIYAYTSKEKAKAGWGEWVAMLAKSYDDTTPTININMLEK